MEVQREVACEIEASGQPLPRRNKQLGPTVGGHLAEVSNGIVEGFGVGSLAISDTSEVGDRSAVLTAAYGLIMIISGQISGTERFCCFNGSHQHHHEGDDHLKWELYC